MINFLKIWKWRIFHRKKENESNQTTPTKPLEEGEKQEDPKDKETPSKGKIGDPPTDKDFKIVPYGTRIKRTKIFACVINGPSAELVNAKIENDWWLKYRTADRKKHEVLIADPPKTYEYSMGWGPFKRRSRALVFYVGYQAEATHDPGRCDYDLPVIEGIVKMAKAITKTDVLKAAADQVKVRSGFWEMFPWIVVCIIVFLFLFAFQIQPNL